MDPLESRNGRGPDSARSRSGIQAEPGSVLLAAVGDLVPSHRLFGADGQPVGGAFSAVVAMLRSADVTFGNLEMALTRVGRPIEKPITFRGSPGLADDIRGIGFDVISLANNHICDYGYGACKDTRRRLVSAGVATFGAGDNLDEAEAPSVVTAGTIRVGFIGWTCSLPGGVAAARNRPGLAPIHVESAIETNPYFQLEGPGSAPRIRTECSPADLERALGRVKELRRRVDFVVVSIHWGFSPGDVLADYQQPLGRAFIDSGADVVLGHHVHAAQGVEAYRGKAIVYGLGGFISQQPRRGASAFARELYRRMSPDALLALLDIDASGSYRLHLRPLSTNRIGLPELGEAEVWNRIATRVQTQSAGWGTSVTPGHGGYLEVKGLASRPSPRSTTAVGAAR